MTHLLISFRSDAPKISNIVNELFGFDEEYFGIVLCNFCSQKIINAIQIQILREEIM